MDELGHHDPEAVHEMNSAKVRIARELLAMAREVMGYEFPSKEALDAYLKDHPKADKAKHWVKDQKPEKNPQKSQEAEKPKTEEKSVDSGKAKFRLPEHKLLKLETPGNLGNVEKWKARIVLGNSMTDKKKVGDMDEVGYVAISTRGDEIVPIARADEHRAGYELLHHLHEKGAIRTSPSDFITLFPGNNYPHYSVPASDYPKYAEAVKKWLAYGGKNVVVHAQKQGAGQWSDGKGRDFVTDMEEFAELGGKLPYGQKGPTKAGQKILDDLENAAGSLKSGDSKTAFERTGKLLERLTAFNSYAYRDWDTLDAAKKDFEEAQKERDESKLGRVISKVAKGMQSSLKEERKSDYSYVAGLFGSGDEADKRIEKVAGAEIGPVKKEGEKRPSISSAGYSVVSSLEKAARASNRGDVDRMADAVVELIADLLPMADKIEGLGAALERVHRAADSRDEKELEQALFAFYGLKNLLHNRLRKLQKDGKANDEHFGDVKTALEEFDRLGQI